MKKKDNEIINEIKNVFIEDNINELKDYELLAFILRSGDETKDVLTLSDNLLRRYNSLFGLRNLTVNELISENKGINEEKALKIIAALELGKRAYLREENKNIVSCSEDVYELLRFDMAFLNKEHFKIVLLDNLSNIISVEDVSIGTINSSLVHSREVFSVAIKKYASRIILVHNHPSGEVNPSNEDIEITNALVKAGELIGIEVIDHVIISKNAYFSLREHSLI